MDTKLTELLSERERLAAYGLHRALALLDAEIARLSASERAPAVPSGRTAPARQTASQSRKDA